MFLNMEYANFHKNSSVRYPYFLFPVQRISLALIGVCLLNISSSRTGDIIEIRVMYILYIIVTMYEW